MSTITSPDAFAASAAASTSTGSASPTTVTNPSSSLGDNTFLELAQFTSLEQETNTATSTQQTATTNATTEALSLLGTSVTYLDSDGNSESGVVSAVDLSGSTPTLTIGGTSGIATSAVTQVS
jgi:flagellar basal-body rod modification protein FlgD